MSLEPLPRPLSSGNAGGWRRALRPVMEGPGQCEVCRVWTRGALCAHCIERHAALRPRCRRCALPLPQAGVCGRCLHAPPPFEHTVCVGDYAFPWDRLVAAYKFEGRVELANPLAARMVAAVAEVNAPRPDGVVPVPLAEERLRQRGYNQAWELARRVAAALRVPTHAGLLLRLFGGAHQAELSRAGRLVALRGAFTVPPSERAKLAGRRIALVDDVMTTGATVSEAAAALLRAGAGAVDVWVVARTPDRRD